MAITSTSHTITAIEVKDNNDGTYTVEYIVTDSSETYTITVTVNGDTGNQKTSTVTAVHNTQDAATSTLLASTPVTIANAESLTLTILDAYSNPVSTAAVPIVTHLTGSGQTVYSTASVTTLATGTYTSSYTLPAGASASNCGVYSVSSYLLTQGGLSASYYTNKWFSGTAYKTQVDTQINMNWGSGEIITGVASDYVSVEWNGYIMPLYTETYTFHTESNDGVRVYVNDQLIIDSLADSSADSHSFILTSTTLALTANQFYPVKVQYYDATGTALVSFSWESAS